MLYNPTSYFEGTNFTHGEVAYSSTADRLGIDNTPDELVLERAELVAIECLQPARVHYGIPFRPNSWFRCPALERVIAGKGFESWCARNHRIATEEEAWLEYLKRKSHPRGEAVDHEIPGVPNDDLFAWYQANVEFDQLIREFPKPGDPSSGWVHISKRAANNRQQAFTIGG